MQSHFNSDNYLFMHICINKQLLWSKTIYESRYIKRIFQLSLIKKEGDCYRRYWGQHESNSKASWCNTRTFSRT